MHTGMLSSITKDMFSNDGLTDSMLTTLSILTESVMANEAHPSSTKTPTTKTSTTTPWAGIFGTTTPKSHHLPAARQAVPIRLSASQSVPFNPWDEVFKAAKVAMALPLPSTPRSASGDSFTTASHTVTRDQAFRAKLKASLLNDADAIQATEWNTVFILWSMGAIPTDAEDGCCNSRHRVFTSGLPFVTQLYLVYTHGHLGQEWAERGNMDLARVATPCVNGDKATMYRCATVSSTWGITDPIGIVFCGLCAEMCTHVRDCPYETPADAEAARQAAVASMDSATAPVSSIDILKKFMPTMSPSRRVKVAIAHWPGLGERDLPRAPVPRAANNTKATAPQKRHTK
jgi:hypothetical protein